MKLENWSLVPSNPFNLPNKVDGVRLLGEVYGHPTRLDGTTIFTSRAVAIKDGLVVTISGSRYELGEPEAEYEADSPNAKQRVLNNEWNSIC